MTEEEQRRLDAFLELTRLERGLRAFIETQLTHADGPGWARALPQDVKEKVESEGIEFTDFPDLKKVLSSAWRRLGTSTDAVDKKQVLTHLEGLEPIRNDIAHSRDVSPGALALVRAAYHVLMPLLGNTGSSTDLPPTVHPGVALDRVRSAVEHSAEVSRNDLALLEGDSAYREVCRTVGGYERVRVRPGRKPSLMKDVRARALDAIDGVEGEGR